MTHMVGQTVDLRIETRQPFVLAEQDRGVTRRQFARQREMMWRQVGVIRHVWQKFQSRGAEHRRQVAQAR